MDPALLQLSRSHQSGSEEAKPAIEIPDESHQSDEESDSHDEGTDEPGSSENAKRPRLRLAHACDRCRKRKIRCDTQQPCGPCQATKNQCTFHIPSRRISKPKPAATIGPDGAVRASSSAGVKRPHSPPRRAILGGAVGDPLGDGDRDRASLEARLAALEAMLRDVPPNVHNAFLSSLDARLGSGTGVGLKEGKGEGVGVAPEALAGGASLGGLLGLGGKWDQGENAQIRGLSAMGVLRQGSTLAPEIDSSVGIGGLGGLGGILRGSSRREDDGVSSMAKKMEGMSFFYEDEIGQAKWQGATSGFPLLDLLTASNLGIEPADSASPPYPDTFSSTDGPSPDNDATRRGASNTFRPMTRGSTSSARIPSSSPAASKRERFFPDRTPRPHQTLNPEASWKVITGVIPPDLMDTLVRCYLSTSHLLWPFLHVPSFLADYANPAQWGEPGFACFIVAVCTLSSRHVDDPRVRANPTDPSTAGKQYFELFKRLRDLPSADRPTLYSIQAAFLAAVYAFGLGNLSKAFALQAESITLCLDGGLHRSVDGYDHFDAVEKETRKRTFWSIYAWDKQSAALFGRPPIIHLRDCDVTEPLVVDDENLTPDGIKEESSANDSKSRMCAFIAAIRLHVILEGVIDSATTPSSFPTSPFLAQAAATIARRSPLKDSLRDEEALLEEWTKLLPKYWQYDSETANSRDPIRITQAERLHCLEHLVKMIIYRHRFSGFVALPASTAEERARHLELCRKAMQCALNIVADHVHISQRGMMTYYGVHVIHQLAQAGRTLVAVILNCRNADFRPLIAPAIEGLRSCVGLLRRFSGRYLCGLRSADIIDEFCRICNIPVDSPRVPDGTGRPSPAWLRPVRRRVTPSPSRHSSQSPATSANFHGEDIMSAPPDLSAPTNAGLNGRHLRNPSVSQADLDAIFNTADYFDLSAMSPAQSGGAQMSFDLGNVGDGGMSGMSGMGSLGTGPNGDAGVGSRVFDYTTGPAPMSSSASTLDLATMVMVNGFGNGDAAGFATPRQVSASVPKNGTISPNGLGATNVSFNYATNGFGGEMFVGEGMDTVSVGLKGGDSQGLSAATILSLLEEGSFDYGAMFTDQAPLPVEMGGV